MNPYDDNSNLMQSIALLPVKCTSTLAPVVRNQQIGVIKQRQSLGSWFTPSIQLQHQEATKPLVVHCTRGQKRRLSGDMLRNGLKVSGIHDDFMHSVYLNQAPQQTQIWQRLDTQEML